jgi:MFS family permease
MAACVYALGVVPIAAMVTPSLAYMAEATSATGARSFGVAYGVYNFAWAVGILGGPALGGFLYERLGFARVAWGWAIAVLIVTGLLARAGRRPASSSAASRAL